MGKKQNKHTTPVIPEVIDTKPIENIQLINREYAQPCNKCRKRDSCIIRPYDNRCTGLDEGIPWSIQYAIMDSPRNI